MSDATAARIPEPEHGHTEPAPHHAVNYLAVFITLVILTVVTVVAALLNVKSELTKVLIALAIASIKASAVVLYFMHLKFEGKLIYLILAVPVTFCILLVFSLLPDVTFAPIFHDFSANAWRFVHG
ncbi:MAG TPA: cytochrome C oxidase subunit IV family protein [Tepidisphaeraceae bacterium]|jgi:cytochrome c oxidase subunit 4